MYGNHTMYGHLLWLPNSAGGCRGEAAFAVANMPDEVEQVGSCVDVHVQMHAHVHVQMHAHVHVQMHAHAHVQMHAHAHVQMHVHVEQVFSEVGLFIGTGGATLQACSDAKNPCREAYVTNMRGWGQVKLYLSFHRLTS